MPRPIVISKALTAASATSIAASQSLGAAGNLTLTSGTVTLDTQRRVLITSAGNDSGITFTVYGTNGANVPISETVTGGNAAAVATEQDFLTVTRIAASGATASTVEAGTNTTGSTQWFLPDQYLTPPSINMGCVITAGSATYSIEVTSDDPRPQPTTILQFGGNPYVPTVPTATAWPTLSAQTGNATGTIDSAVMAWRLTITSGTGTVRATASQAGLTQL